MLYAVVGGVIVLVVISLAYLFYRRRLAMRIMETGIRIKGIMIECREKPANPRNKLEGHFYLPMISFFTADGQPIVGTPVLGFKSFEKLVAPMDVQVIYDPKNPKRFCFEMK